MKKIIIFLLMAIPTFAFGFFFDLTEKQKDGMISSFKSSTEEKIKQSSLYLKANYFTQSGEYQKAMQTYNDLFLLEPSPLAYEGYIKLLSATNQFPEIVKIIDKTEDEFKDNLEIQLIYIQSLLNTNKEKEAENLLAELKQKYPNNEQVTLFSAAYQEQQQNFDQALAIINSFLAKKHERSKFFMFHFLKSKILMKMGRVDEALQSVEKSLDLYQGFDKGVLFKGAILEQIGKIDEAIKCYKEFQKLNSNENIISKHLIQLLISQKRFKEALAELRKLDNNHPEYFFDLALLELRSGNSNMALTEINKAIKQAPQFKEAKFLKIEILFQLKRHKEILNVMNDLVEDAPIDESTINALLTLSNAGINHIEITKILDSAHKTNPKNHKILIVSGDIHLKNKNYEQSIEQYYKALSLIEDVELKSKIEFQIGFTHFVLGNNDKAINVLENSANSKVVYPSTYNLLACCLMRNNKDLNKALTYVDKAIEQDPSSPFHLDTKGMLLKKQNKFSEATEMFERALKISPDDKIIQSHLKNAKKKS